MTVLYRSTTKNKKWADLNESEFSDAWDAFDLHVMLYHKTTIRLTNLRVRFEVIAFGFKRIAPQGDLRKRI